MGNQPSQDKKLNLLDLPRKEGDITIKPIGELPKIDTKGFELPKAPLIKSKSQMAQEAQDEERKLLIPFSLKFLYDKETFKGRFKEILARFNPFLFVINDKKIKEAQELIFKHRMREEAAAKINSRVMLKQEEIDGLKRAEKIVSGCVHPQTDEIIHPMMRPSSFTAACMLTPYSACASF